MGKNRTLEEIYAAAGRNRGLIDNLREVFKEKELVRWFYRPNKAFEYQKPIDLLGTKEVRRLKSMYREIVYGTYL